MDNFDEIVFKEKEKRISISRIPPRIKKEFVEFSDAEFCSDYGACLHYVWDNFKLWKTYFENMDMKLNIIIDNLNIPSEEPAIENVATGKIRLLSGKSIKKGVENSNGSTK